MAEVIGPDAPRIKFAARRTGELQLPAAALPSLLQLAALMQRLEARGFIPILGDGLVGGNCAMVAPATGSGGYVDSSSANASSTAGGGSRCSALQVVLISRSGKPPGHVLQAGDWVLLQRFDPASWSAEYQSASEAARPSSDAPLHAAALGPGAAERYGWPEAPAVAVHGHALAEGPGGCAPGVAGGWGWNRMLCPCVAAQPATSSPSARTCSTARAGLERARRAGLAISEQETLFSTPDDLAALEALFRCLQGSAGPGMQPLAWLC